MTISQTKNGNDLLVNISGRLDSATSGEFMDYLTQNFTQDIQNLTLNFADVDFISSKGLRVLVSVYKILNGRQMKIINTNSSVKEIFNISSLTSIFNIE